MKLSLLAIVCFPGAALAISPTSPSNSIPQPTAELKVMTERLHLSQSQQDQIAPILVAEFDKRKAIQDDTSLSVQQKHDQTGQVHRAALQQIKAVFTSEQLAQIEQGQDHPETGPTHP
jgi:hypothetical protein